MTRSALIIGLLLCTVVFLFGRMHTLTATPDATPMSPRPNIVQSVGAAAKAAPRPAAASAAQAVARTLPTHAAQMARLEQEYRDHPGLRQLVANFNAITGHPGRGVTASLEAIDQNAVAGAPVFGLFQAVQPRAEMARAFEPHWRDERTRRERNNPPP